MENTAKRQHVSRAPNGIDPRRINMPLTPDEKAELKDIAQQDSRSDGAMARRIYLLGLAVYKAERAGAQP